MDDNIAVPLQYFSSSEAEFFLNGENIPLNLKQIIKKRYNYLEKLYETNEKKFGKQYAESVLKTVIHKIKNKRKNYNNLSQCKRSRTYADVINGY